MLAIIAHVAVVCALSAPAADPLAAVPTSYQVATAGQAGLLGPKVTMAKFKAIKKGMSYKQVVKILGFEGEEMSSSDVAGYSTVMYAWRNLGGSNMNAMFQNGKLIMKGQFGL